LMTLVRFLERPWEWGFPTVSDNLSSLASANLRKSPAE
jgi:hypothetical protein